jgi:CMP-N,N'-diacetyllegionaminic acid synthase
MRKNLQSVALIPARLGSKRIKHKNIAQLNGHPMMAYSIRAAIESKVFTSVVCITDSKDYSMIAQHYGAEVPKLRPKATAGDSSPDIEWVSWALKILEGMNRSYEIFSILRPTSPFRKASTIRRAYKKFLSSTSTDSLRAVEKCKQHPGKMWLLKNNLIDPLLPYEINGTPWHSNQYKALPDIYIQNASLEIAWTKIITEENNISGKKITPFFCKEFEGFDINEPEDLILANNYIKTDFGILPRINTAAYIQKKRRIHGR